MVNDVDGLVLDYADDGALEWTETLHDMDEEIAQSRSKSRGPLRIFSCLPLLSTELGILTH